MTPKDEKFGSGTSLYSRLYQEEQYHPNEGAHDK